MATRPTKSGTVIGGAGSFRVWRFTSTEISTILGDDPRRLREWITRGYFTASRPAKGRGTQATFDRYDLYEAALLKFLLDRCGIDRARGSEVAKLLVQPLRTMAKIAMTPEFITAVWRPGEGPKVVATDVGESPKVGVSKFRVYEGKIPDEEARVREAAADYDWRPSSMEEALTFGEEAHSMEAALTINIARLIKDTDAKVWEYWRSLRG